MQSAGIRDAKLNNWVIVIGLLLAVIFSMRPSVAAYTRPPEFKQEVITLEPTSAPSRGELSSRGDIVPLPTPTPTPEPLPTPVPPDEGWTSYVEFPPTPQPTPVPLPQPTNVLMWPVNGGRISQYFSSAHPAVDIAIDCGTTVMASDAGVVSWAGWRTNGGGNVVEINHGWGVTGYNHLGSYSVSAGQAVAKGQAIAAVGTTGNSTGCHVHWTLVVNGYYVNPLNYLPASTVIEEGPQSTHEPISTVIQN